jgi:hypothetical protein
MMKVATLIATALLCACSHTRFVVESDIPGVAGAVGNALATNAPVATCGHGGQVRSSADAKTVRRGVVREKFTLETRCSK